MAASTLTRSAIVLLTLLLAACQSYPLGMSETEWNRLTPAEQLAARTRQAELDRARAQQRAERLAIQRQREALRAAEERRRIAQLYAHARYGDIVECVIKGGIADFHPGWRQYLPAPFTLARGEAKYITFQGPGHRGGRFWSRYSPDGRAVTVCYRDGTGRHARGCVTVGAMSRDFQMGIERSLSIDDVFRNARLVCAYRPGPGMPRYVIRQYNVEVRRVVEYYHHSRRPAATRRLVEEHRWYTPTVAPARGEREIRPDRDAAVRGHRRPVERASRSPESDRGAPPDDRARAYTPKAAPGGPSDHRVPRASARARAVAAPESAVRGKAGKDEAVREADQPCDRGKPHGQARGHRDRTRAETACSD